MNALFVILGGAAGAWTRYLIFTMMEERSETFPWHTLLVNLAGCFLIGLITEYFAFKSYLPLQMKLFLVSGFLSSFTTFSTFALDAGLLIERHEYLKVSSYILASVILGIFGYFLAIWLIRAFVIKG